MTGIVAGRGVALRHAFRHVVPRLNSMVPDGTTHAIPANATHRTFVLAAVRQDARDRGDRGRRRGVRRV